MNKKRNVKQLDFEALSLAAECLKALAHPSRLQIVQLLMSGKQYSVNDLAEKFSGAVGQFLFENTIFPAKATSSNLIKITSTISGTGYIPEEYLPRVSHVPNFIIYDPEITHIRKGKN